MEAAYELLEPFGVSWSTMLLVGFSVRSGGVLLLPNGLYSRFQRASASKKISSDAEGIPASISGQQHVGSMVQNVRWCKKSVEESE